MRKVIRDTSSSKMRSLSDKLNIEKYDVESCGGYTYYKENLSREERNAYEIIKEGMCNFDRRITLGTISSKNCESIFNAILLDMPMLFHVNGSAVVEMGRKISLLPKYIMSSDEYRRYKIECVRTLQQLCKNGRGSVWDKILALHEGFISSITYGDEKQEAHDIIGPLLQHKGVCDGIAKSVKAACDFMNIPCIIIRGEARKEEGGIGNHAWNAIMIDSEWRFFDFTFDITLNPSNPCKGIQRMDYFSISYDDMSIDHFKWGINIKPTNQGKDYFEYNNIVVKKQQDLDRIICDSSNKPIEKAFKVDGSWQRYNNNKALEMTVNRLMERTKSDCRYTYTYNESQRVGYVRIE